MFATPTSYCVTPTRPRPLMRLPERASTFLRDVKRRSLRVKRSKSMVISTPEKRKSGETVLLNSVTGIRFHSKHSQMLFWS